MDQKCQKPHYMSILLLHNLYYARYKAVLL